MLLSVCYVAIQCILQLVFLLFQSAQCKELVPVATHDNCKAEVGPSILEQEPKQRVPTR